MPAPSKIIQACTYNLLYILGLYCSIDRQWIQERDAFQFWGELLQSEIPPLLFRR